MTVNKEWQKIKVNKIPPKKLKRLLEQEDLYVLDVRPLDFRLNASFIKGAVHCPLVYLADRYTKIPKNRRLVITDYAMKQSSIVAKFLSMKGYQIVGVLKGGLERWNSEGLPTEQRVPTQKIGSFNALREK